jgi:ketosteroid isomerase-like protein
MCGCAKRPTKDNHADDESKIRELEIEASKALVAKDLGKLVFLYADDAALYDERDPSIRGRDAIRKAWRTTFAQPGLIIRTDPQTVEISNGGDLGWGHGLLVMKVDGHAGRPITEQWEYALVYMKSGGRWKIIADCVYSGIRNHLAHRPPKSLSPLAAIAPLIGMACFLSGIWFLLGMPIVFLIQTWKSIRALKVSTGFLVSVVMLIAFFLTAALFWRHLAAHEWNLSFVTLSAALDSARYGNPVEDTAEGVLISLITLSTLSALAAGVIIGSSRKLWIRRRRHAV